MFQSRWKHREGVKWAQLADQGRHRHQGRRAQQQ